MNIDVYATTHDHEVIELSVPSTHLNGFLIGQHADNIRAFQYTISTALRNQGYSHYRVNLDVADYKKQRDDRLAQRAEEWFRQVKDSNQEMELEPMHAAQRRVIHQAATDFDLQTQSIGEGRDRRIVLKPAIGSITDSETEEVESEDESETPEKTKPKKSKE
jgi:spoIIIJ-associated protein